MSAKDNLTKYVGVSGGWFRFFVGFWGWGVGLFLLWFFFPRPVSFLYAVQFYINCQQHDSKAKLSFSLFQGPS